MSPRPAPFVHRRHPDRRRSSTRSRQAEKHAIACHVSRYFHRWRRCCPQAIGQNLRYVRPARSAGLGHRPGTGSDDKRTANACSCREMPGRRRRHRAPAGNRHPTLRHQTCPARLTSAGIADTPLRSTFASGVGRRTRESSEALHTRALQKGSHAWPEHLPTVWTPHRERPAGPRARLDEPRLACALHVQGVAPKQLKAAFVIPALTAGLVPALAAFRAALLMTAGLTPAPAIRIAAAIARPDLMTGLTGRAHP